MPDSRDVPLDDFEQEILGNLLVEQSRLLSATVDSPRSVRNGLSRRPGVVVAGMAAAVALGVVSFELVGNSPTGASATPVLPAPLAFTHGTESPAVAMLNAAARAEASRTPSPDPVTYAETQSYALQTNVSSHLSTTVVVTVVNQVWRSPDGTTLVRQYRQNTAPAGGDIGGPQAPTGSNDSGTYPPGQWADPNVGFPSTPPAVRSALKDPATTGNASLTTITTAYEIGEHLSTGTATPAQTAALYRVLATLPGVFDAGTVTDSVGRVGDAVGIVVSDSSSLVTGTEYFVFDASTGQFLEDEIVDTPGAPPALHLPDVPTVQQYETVLASGNVASPGASPIAG